MMIESPVGTTYELRSHSLLPVGPRMTDKADSCGELSTAVITGKASCICGLGCGDELPCRTFPSAALLYCSGGTNFLKVLHPGEASIFMYNACNSICILALERAPGPPPPLAMYKLIKKIGRINRK